MKVFASGTENYLQVTLGTPRTPEDVHRADASGFAFGETAEVTVSRAGYGDDNGREVAVSFAAIGSHDAATAARRANVYAVAAALAAELEPFKMQNLTQLAVLINGRVEPFITALRS